MVSLTHRSVERLDFCAVTRHTSQSMQMRIGFASLRRYEAHLRLCVGIMKLCCDVKCGEDDVAVYLSLAMATRIVRSSSNLLYKLLPHRLCFTTTAAAAFLNPLSINRTHPLLQHGLPQTPHPLHPPPPPPLPRSPSPRPRPQDRHQMDPNHLRQQDTLH